MKRVKTEDTFHLPLHGLQVILQPQQPMEKQGCEKQAIMLGPKGSIKVPYTIWASVLSDASYQLCDLGQILDLPVPQCCDLSNGDNNDVHSVGLLSASNSFLCNKF